MLNQFLNKGFYGLLGLALTVLVSGDIAEQKYLQGTAKAILASSVSLAIKKDKEEIGKLSKDLSKANISQEYLYEQLSVSSIKYGAMIEKLELVYENKIKELEVKLSSWEAQNKDLQLNIEALSLLCSREFAQLKKEIEGINADFAARSRQIQQKAQSTKDKVNELKVSCHRKHQQIEHQAQSIQDKLNHRLVRIEAGLKSTEAKIHSISLKKNPNKPRVKQPQLAKVASLSPATRTPKTIVLIDQANFHHACHDLGIEPDYKDLMAKLMPEQGEFEIRIYVGVFDRPSQSQKASIRELKSLGYRVIQMPIQQRRDNTCKLVGDDVRLSCDLVEMAALNEITAEDKVILVSGDGDYFPALEKLQTRGIDITLVASNPSRHLDGFWNRHLDLHLIKYDICQHQKLHSVA